VGGYWLQTLGCPKNQVDSDKLEGHLEAQGYDRAPDPGSADLVVVNTCAFIEAARQESIDTVLSLAERRAGGARLVVTGCMAERYGDELRDALPEVDLVAGFGRELVELAPMATASAVSVSLGAARIASQPGSQAHAFDLLELPRPSARAPWAYVKVAEGCDRICGFCAIPSFRGKQRSRSSEDVLAEVDALRATTDGAPPLREIVLVAQDLASYGRDRSGPGRGTRIAGGIASSSKMAGTPCGTGSTMLSSVVAIPASYADVTANAARASRQRVARPSPPPFAAISWAIAA